MPTRADMEAAVPRCPRHGVLREGRQYPNERCLQPLRRDVAKDTVGRPVFTDWRCSWHGRISGSEVASKATMGVAA